MESGKTFLAKIQRNRSQIFPAVLQLIKKGEIAGTVLNDGVNQGKAVVQLSANLANGKAATEGTKWKLENRVVRIPYVGVDKDNLSEFLK